VTTAATVQMIAWGDIVLAGYVVKIFRRSGPGERIDISAEAGLRADGPFSNEVEGADVPALTLAKGSKCHAAVLSRAD
jgi:hypothetical protein